MLLLVILDSPATIEGEAHTGMLSEPPDEVAKWRFPGSRFIPLKGTSTGVELADSGKFHPLGDRQKTSAEERWFAI